MTSSAAFFNPFPGLRPFRESESHLFFGRSDQVDELLGELSRSRFVAVMGASGSGKSSLVKAGLLPALHGGFSLRVGSHWRIATFRPGGNPIHNLARALVSPDVLGADDPDPVVAAARMEAVLRRSRLGLADAVQRGGLEQGRLLVVVDQFEELFRYDSTSGHADAPSDAATFVQLLIETSRADVPVDVILTMRSDFLGDCSQFRELPETINRGLYLVPRLTRSQLRETITAPAAVGGGAIAPLLVQRLLNDAGADPDVLPVLQHALMRTWDIWADGGTPTGPIDLSHYEAAGRLDDALARHADEALHELDGDRVKRVAELMFKRLTELGADRREVRRPSPLAELAEVTAATPAEVEETISHFGRQGRSFVHTSADGVVDISHESLIRQWPRLREWVREEAVSRDTYRRLAGSAERWKRGEAALLRNPDLQIADNWWAANRPNQAWADRYDPDFDQAARYLEASRRAAGRRRLLALAGVVVLAVLTVVSAVSAVVALNERSKAEAAAAEALVQRDRAEGASVEADLARADAERQQRLAVSRQLAAQSIGAGPTNRVLSILTALEALRATAADGVRVPAAEEALRGALSDPLSTRLPGPPGQLGHTGSVRTVAFSPDGSRLATGGDDATVLLWDPADPTAEPQVLAGHTEAITAVAFDPGGRWLATGSADATVVLWDLRDLTSRALVGHGDGITSLAFGPRGRWLASGSTDNTTRLWDLDDPDLASVILDRHRGFVRALAFSPDGTLLVTGSGDETALVWDVDEIGSEPLRLAGHTDDVDVVAFSPDGRRVATASRDGAVILWDPAGVSSPIDPLTHRGAVNTMAFGPDGRWLATGSGDRTVRLWDLRDPAGPAASPVVWRQSNIVEIVAFGGDWVFAGNRNSTVLAIPLSDPSGDQLVLGGHEMSVTDLDVRADGRWLASSSNDGSARLWDLADLSTRPAILDHPVLTDGYSRADVAALAFSPDGSTLATATIDKTVRLWEVGAPGTSPEVFRHERVEGFELAGVTALAYSPDGRQLATGSGDRTVRVWDVDAPDQPLTTIEVDESVTAVAFSPDGERLAVGIKDEVALMWALNDIEAGPKRLVGHDDEVTAVTFSADGRWLATGSRDATVLLWDASGDDPRPLRAGADHVTTLAFSRDGGRLATGSRDRTIRVWDLDGSDPAVEFRLDHGSPVTSVALSPDGSLLAAADRVSVQLWDLTIADPADPLSNPVVLRAHTGPVNAVAFSADGRHFATGGEDETTRLWLLVEDLIPIGCQGAGRNFTQAEWQSLLPGEPYRVTCEEWPPGP